MIRWKRKYNNRSSWKQKDYNYSSYVNNIRLASHFSGFDSYISACGWVPEIVHVAEYVSEGILDVYLVQHDGCVIGKMVRVMQRGEEWAPDKVFFEPFIPVTVEFEKNCKLFYGVLYPEGEFIPMWEYKAGDLVPVSS